MHELRHMENGQLNLKQDQRVSLPRVAEIQNLVKFGSHVHCSSQHDLHNLDTSAKPLCLFATCFVFVKVFKILHVTSPHQVETAAACIMFNGAVTNHIACFQLISSPLQDDDSIKSGQCLQSLLEASHLYRLVLKILEHNVNDGTAITLSIVARNNYAAVLAAVDSSFANEARDLYHSLFHRLSEIEETHSNVLQLDVFDMGNVYKSCLSSVFQICYTMTAPAA